jgi:hypothetical protein
MDRPMEKFRIWVAEDENHRAITEALKQALGANGEYALYRVFPNPMDPIIECENATGPQSLPDVALIDVNFKSAPATGPIVDVQAESRGFVVAAELKHWAAHFGKKDFTFGIYTGNKVVMDQFQWLYKNPYGHEPLLPIAEKGGMVDGFHFIPWIRSHCHKLVKTRLREADVDLSDLSNFIDELKLNIQALWSTEWQLCMADFQESIAPVVEAFIASYNEAQLSRTDEEKRNDYLPVQRLRAAQTTGAVTYALTRSHGKPAQQLSEPLRVKIKEFNEKYRRLLATTREVVLEMADEFTSKDLFQEFIGPLFPFEAWEIAGSSDPETIGRALRTILDLLGESIDHNYTLVRAFKYFRMPKSDVELPTTVFAAACHTWDQTKWIFDFPIPDLKDLAAQELMLCEEVGKIEIQDKDRPVLRLPAGALERIISDGNHCAGGASTYPLVDFATSAEKDIHWAAIPADYLKKKFAGVPLAISPAVFSSRAPVLTDWRNFFGADGTSNSGLIDRIMAEIKSTTVKHAGIHYDDEAKRVAITIEFKVEKHFGPIYLQKPGGRLTTTLKEFLGWGKLEVHTNDKNTCYSTPWPGGTPESYKGDTESPCFKLVWSIPHYLETRTLP